MLNYYTIITSPFTIILCALSLIYLFRNKLEIFIAKKLNSLIEKQQKKRRPKRIILIRHAFITESNNPYFNLHVIDNKIHLSEKGIAQAKKAGKKLKKLIGNESIDFYVSPYACAQETYKHILENFQINRTECNIASPLREQEFGNIIYDLDAQFKEQEEVGVLYYRFKNGESGMDVLNRITIFLQFLFRKISSINYKLYDNIIIVSHELTIKFFILNFLKLPIDSFENIKGIDHGEYWIIEKNEKGKYQLNDNIFFKRSISSKI